VTRDWFPATAAQFLVVEASAVAECAGGHGTLGYLSKSAEFDGKKRLELLRGAKNCKRMRKNMKGK